MEHIDWTVVQQHLTCPVCGRPARITPGTDGFEASCEPHTFKVTRRDAIRLTREHGKPTYERLRQRIAELEEQLTRINNDKTP